MAIDPITLDILWNRLIAATNDQAAALMRSSFTSIVRESGDLSAGVFDRRGRMIAQAVTGTPGHINSMATGMTHFLHRFPVDTLEPGDVLVTNDPWKTASQLNDITIATPVFRNRRCIALFANCCHALDIGGRGLSADSRSVFEEGMFIPVMKLFDRGTPVEAIFELLRANVRTPEEVLGDIHCQVVGNEAGAMQLLSFLDEFALENLEELADVIVERSEAAMRARIRALPDGQYPFELTIDGFENPLVLKATIFVDDDELTVDYAGSPGPVPLGINVTLNYTHAYTTYGVKCALAGDIPNNEGSFIPVHVTAPEGSLLNARYPAAVGGRHLVGHFLPSVVMGALADALPDDVMAPGYDGLWDTHVSGVDRRSGEHFSFTWFSAGGTGALKGSDGLSATAYPSGIAGVPAEVSRQRLRDADQDAADKRAEQTAETADDDDDEGQQGVARREIGMHLEQQQNDRAGRAEAGRADSEREGVEPGDVQPHYLRAHAIVRAGADRLASRRVLEEGEQQGGDDHRGDRGEHLRVVDDQLGDREGIPGVADLNTLRVGAEDHQERADDHDRDRGQQQELHVLRQVGHPADDEELQHVAEAEQQHRRQRHRQERVEPEPAEHQQREEHTHDHDLAMGEIDDTDDAEK